MTPQEIEAMKREINDDLDIIIGRFNADMAAWEGRTKSEASFMWRFDPRTGKKILSKNNVHLPVFLSEVTYDQVEEILTKLTDQPEIPLEKLV